MLEALCGGALVGTETALCHIFCAPVFPNRPDVSHGLWRQAAWQRIELSALHSPWREPFSVSEPSFPTCRVGVKATALGDVVSLHTGNTQ